MPLLPNAAENTMIQSQFTPTTTYYLSLHSASPGQTGLNELSGGSYARQAITFGAAVAGVMASTSLQTFPTLPAVPGGIFFFGIWSASSGGTYEGGGAVTGAGGPVGAGSTITFAIGQITAGISS